MHLYAGVDMHVFSIYTYWCCIYVNMCLLLGLSVSLHVCVGIGSVCVCTFMCVYHHHHHHPHHVVPLAQIFMIYSLAIRLHHPSHSAGPLDYILCLHRAVVDKF